MNKEILNANMERRIVTKAIDDKVYLCIYLDQKNIPDKHYTKMIYNLNDILKITMQSCHEYDGLIINPDKDDIVISNDFIWHKYIKNKTLTNDERTIELLKSLSEQEKDWVGRSIYKILTLVYIENKTVDEIAKLFNTDKSKIGKALTAGYKYLSEVLFLRF